MDTFNGAGGIDTLNVTVAAGAAAQTLTAVFDGVKLTSFDLGAGSVALSNIEVVDANLGDGTDTLAITSPAGVNVNLVTGTASGFSSITGIENIIGSAFDDTLTGTTGNNILTGLAGNDTMVGGLGDDTYVVDNTGDVVTESTNGGIDTVQSSLTFSLTPLADVENLTLTGTSNINGTGNGLDNVIIGNSGNNTLAGLAGADTFVFSDPGFGNDTITDFDTSNDVIQFNAALFANYRRPSTALSQQGRTRSSPPGTTRSTLSNVAVSSLSPTNFRFT